MVNNILHVTSGAENSSAFDTIAGYWEAWSGAIPLAPFILILFAVALILWVLMRIISHRKRMF